VKIGITGGSGFIGGHVAEVALARGHSVAVMDRVGRQSGTFPGQESRIMEAQLDGRLETFLGDVRSEDDLMELAAHTDGIIHLAACLGTQETVQNPSPAAHTNIFGGLHFLEACAQYDVPGVYIGVGNHWMNNTYSITKTSVERLVQMYNAERGTRVNVVRVVNAYGPRQSVAPPYGSAKVRKITPSFVCRALTGAPIEIYGDGHQVSDMVYVRDAALGLVRALEEANDWITFEQVVEVGPDQHATVLEVAKLVRRLAREVTGNHSEISFLPMRPGEVPGSKVTANTLSLELVGMSADGLVPLEDGMRRTVEWFFENWLPKWKAENT
jgi:UDP-glucose 4-epimerase